MNNSAQTSSTPPVVLCISGNDPTGGAGIAADIETIASIGCQPAPVISTLTVQDSHNVKTIHPVDASLLKDQASAIFNDCDVKAIKVGLIGSVENIEAIASLASKHKDVPLILDTILRAGGGKNLSNQNLIDALRKRLLPLTTVLTPNSEEARTLSSEQELNKAAESLLASGCRSVLITGTHEDEIDVVNRLYEQGQESKSFHWPRLPHSYHGSGCTITSAIAAFIAQGLTPLKAVIEAQQFTWESLQHGFRTGKGQHQPNRLFWAQHRT